MTARLRLSTCHLVRAGVGLDAVRVQASGYGVLVGAAGVRLVWGGFDRIVLRRFSRSQARVLFIGLHGVRWLNAPLAAATPLSLPRAPGSLLPTVSQPLTAPRAQISLRVQLPPMPDVTTGEPLT